MYSFENFPDSGDAEGDTDVLPDLSAARIKTEKQSPVKQREHVNIKQESTCYTTTSETEDCILPWETLFEIYFSKKKVPTVKNYNDLAKTTGLKLQTVMNWFQKKRAETSKSDNSSIGGTQVDFTVRYLKSLYAKRSKPAPEDYRVLNVALEISRDDLNSWFGKSIPSDNDGDSTENRDGSGGSLSEEAKEILDRYFKKISAPSDKLIKSIAKKMNLPHKEVMNWFELNQEKMLYQRRQQKTLYSKEQIELRGMLGKQRNQARRQLYQMQAVVLLSDAASVKGEIILLAILKVMRK